MISCESAKSQNLTRDMQIVRMHHARIQMRFNLMATGEAPLDYAIILELDHAYESVVVQSDCALQPDNRPQPTPRFLAS